LGFRILEVPQAEQLIDDRTFVMSPFSVGYEMLSAPEYAQPVLFVGNTRSDLQLQSKERLDAAEL
jgi:hypothetical protein